MKKLLGIVICLYLSYLSFNLYRSYCHLYKAITYLNQNNESKAMRELKIANKQNGFNIISRYYEAGLEAKDDPVEALRLYEQVEAKNSNFLLTHYFKSLIYKRLGLYSQAYTEILEAEKLFPLDEVIQQEKKDYKIMKRLKK